MALMLMSGNIVFFISFLCVLFLSYKLARLLLIPKTNKFGHEYPGTREPTSVYVNVCILT